MRLSVRLQIVGPQTTTSHIIHDSESILSFLASALALNEAFIEWKLNGTSSYGPRNKEKTKKGTRTCPVKESLNGRNMQRELTICGQTAAAAVESDKWG